MVITFATIIFVFLFLLKPLQKNSFFILYSATMVISAYYCEYKLGWRVMLFSKPAFLLFLLFHFPLINLFTFLAYGRDKNCAQRGEWRIPEIQLHTLELLGGTIGAIAGQKIFHHKNKKKAYMATFFATIVIQVGIIFFILRYLHFF